jgi:hypothetical protein
MQKLSGDKIPVFEAVSYTMQRKKYFNIDLSCWNFILWLGKHKTSTESVLKVQKNPSYK